MSADSVHVKQMSILFVLLYLQLEPDLIITSLLHWEIKLLFSHKSSSIKQKNMFLQQVILEILKTKKHVENLSKWIGLCFFYEFSLSGFYQGLCKETNCPKKLPKKFNIPIKLVLLWNSWESFRTSLSDHQRDLGYCTVLLKLSMFLCVDIDPSPILRTPQVLQDTHASLENFLHSPKDSHKCSQLVLFIQNIVCNHTVHSSL